MKTKGFLLLIASLALGCGSVKDILLGEAPTLKVTNETGYLINEVQMSKCGAADYETIGHRFSGFPLRQGQTSQKITVKEGCYDLKAVIEVSPGFTADRYSFKQEFKRGREYEWTFGQN